MSERIYCDGALTPARRKALLARRLDEGFVCTDYVPRGQNGNDIAYFRRGTPAEIAQCRELMRRAEKTNPVSSEADGAVTSSNKVSND